MTGGWISGGDAAKGCCTGIDCATAVFVELMICLLVKAVRLRGLMSNSKLL
jgi:hypothetical protein